MAFIVCSDAGGINTKGSEMVDEEGLPTDSTQGAWIVLAAEKLPCGGQQIKASPIAWRSSKLKRNVFSTYGHGRKYVEKQLFPQNFLHSY